MCGKNTAEEQALCREVQEAVESGRVTAELREKLGLPGNERVAAGLLRTWAQDGTEIKGFVPHFVDRIIGQQAANDIPMPGMRRGVAIEDALEALRNPVSVGQIQISSNGLKFVTYKGRNCIVRVNPDTGMLIQCNPN